MGRWNTPPGLQARPSSEGCSPALIKYRAIGCSWGCNPNSSKAVTPTAKARRDPKPSRMVERDAVTPRVTLKGARSSTGHFKAAAFDGNNDRRAVPRNNRRTRWVIEYLPAQGDGIAILQRDILRVGRRGCRDALGSAGLVVAVGRGVVGGDGEGARVARDFEGAAAVGGIDAHLLRGIGGGPYLRGGDDAALGGVGGTGRGDDLAGYGCGVCVGDRSGLGGWIALGGNGDGAYGGIEESLFPDGEGEGNDVRGDLCDGYGVCFPRTVPTAAVPASEVTVVREGPVPSSRGFPLGSLNSRVKLRVLSGLSGFPGLMLFPPGEGQPVSIIIAAEAMSGNRNLRGDK